MCDRLPGDRPARSYDLLRRFDREGHNAPLRQTFADQSFGNPRGDITSVRCRCSVAGPLPIGHGPGTIGPDRKAADLLEIGDDTVTV